jgi:hypothetical protein
MLTAHFQNQENFLVNFSSSSNNRKTAKKMGNVQTQDLPNSGFSEQFRTNFIQKNAPALPSQMN